MRIPSRKGFIKNNKGSITLEAAVAIPLYTFAIIILVSIIEMLRCYGDMETNLHRAGRELAIYTAMGEAVGLTGDMDMDDAASKVLEDAYTSNLVINNLNNNNQAKEYIENETGGISFMGNLLDGGNDDKDIIELSASYKLCPSINFWGVGGIAVANRVRVHAWNGYELETNEDEDEERMVYITETGTVYHLTPTCTHINLSIMPIDYELVGGMTNEYGRHYGRCEICGGASTGTIFITKDGDCYHSSLTCSGLKRTVQEIPISRVDGRLCCQRCVANN